MASKYNCEEDPGSDDSEHTIPNLDFRYGLLCLRESTSPPKIFALAMKELKECFQQLYLSKCSSKSLKSQLFRDAMHFVEAINTQQPTIHDRVALKLEVSSMVKAAGKVMPNQRSRELSSLLKQCQITYSRDKQKLGAVHTLEDESECLQLVDLPSDVLSSIMTHLDPISLAVLDSTCSRMHRAADDDAWKRQMQHHFTEYARQSQGFGWKFSFRQMAIRHPNNLVYWRYRRVLVGGSPQWAEPGEYMHHPAIDAVKWCLEGEGSLSRSCKEESSDEETDVRSKTKLWKLGLT